MTDYSSVCPGYKQVEAFGPDDEYEEEEIAYVTLDLGNVEPTLIPSSSNYRLIGLDTPTPFLQLSGTVFKGRHDSLLGTEMLFTDGKDPSDSSKRAVTHVANTEQRICFKEVQLRPKPEVVAEEVEVNEEQERHKLDMMTGKTARVPLPRGRRKAAQQAAETVEESGEPEEDGGPGGADKS
ncbi:hypothetical protein FB45DRAFT_899990 [Roridomyces roridus]|uniref:Transcription factor TFIIIC triple barrel domain-containing protein n=1 Tax=Roridomyces roridus TaxID=1738132 RepID=A0AAD7C7P6_9AGAR|nr:hypothetical protein FB45DRAFT_899990 [Roridomyces roridus]